MDKDGWITLHGKVLSETKDIAEFEFVVEDNGVGIPKAKQAKLLIILTMIPVLPWFLHNSNYLMPSPGQAEQVVE